MNIPSPAFAFDVKIAKPVHLSRRIPKTSISSSGSSHIISNRVEEEGKNLQMKSDAPPGVATNTDDLPWAAMIRGTAKSKCAAIVSKKTRPKSVQTKCAEGETEVQLDRDCMTIVSTIVVMVNSW